MDRTALEHALTDDKNQKASLEEVQSAIESLDSDAFLKLGRVAARLALGTSYRAPDDLLCDALVAALSLKRRWKIRHSFFSFLCLAMKSIASNDRESIETQSECLASELQDKDDTSHDEALANADVRTHVQNRMTDEATEAQLAANRARADQVFALFADDDEITMILMAMEDGHRGSEIQNQSGLTVAQYETARRRMNRKLDSAYPERKSR